MLVEREECSPEHHKQRNNLSLLPLSFLLAETDGLESDWIASGFPWDFCLLCILSVCMHSFAHKHKERDWQLAMSAK